MQLFVMHFSPVHFYFLSLRSKYLPQLPGLEYPQPMSSLNVTDQVSHPYKAAGTFTFIFMLIFHCQVA